MIVIIYDSAQGKNMKGTENCTELFFDRKKMQPEQFITNVMNIIVDKHNTWHASKKQSEAFGGLVLAGLGLLFLGAVLSNDK